MPILKQNSKAPYKTNAFKYGSGLLSSDTANNLLSSDYSETKLGNMLLRIAKYYFTIGCSEEDKDCLNQVFNLYYNEVKDRTNFVAWCAIGTYFLIDKLNGCLGTKIKFPGNSETYGNAKDTYEKFVAWAELNNIQENSTPKAGSIFYRYSTESGSSGHLGVVLTVSKTGSIITIEPNITTGKSEKGAFGMFQYTSEDLANIGISFIHIEDYPYNGPMFIFTEKGCEPEPVVSTPPPAKTSEWTCIVDLDKDDQYTDSSGTLIKQLFVANYQKYKSKEEFLKYFRTTSGDDFSGDKNIAPAFTVESGTFASTKTGDKINLYAIDLKTCKASLVPNTDTPPPKTPPPTIAKSIPCLVELPSNMYFQTVSKELVTYLFVRNFTKYPDVQKFLDMIKADESKKYLSDGNIFAVKKVGNDYFAWVTNRGKQQWNPVNASKCQIEGIQLPCNVVTIPSNVKHWASLVKDFWNQPKGSSAVSKYDIIADICDANWIRGTFSNPTNRSEKYNVDYLWNSESNLINGYSKRHGAALWFNAYSKLPAPTGFGVFQDEQKNKIWVLAENMNASNIIVENGLVNATPKQIDNKEFTNYFGIQGQTTNDKEAARRADAANLLEMKAYYSSGYNSSKGSGSVTEDAYKGELGLDWNSETNDWDIKVPYSIWGLEGKKIETFGNQKREITTISIDLFKVLEFVEKTKKKLRNPIVIRINKRQDEKPLITPDVKIVLGIVGALASVSGIPVSPYITAINKNLPNIEIIGKSINQIASGEPVQAGVFLNAIYNTAANLAPDTVKGLNEAVKKQIADWGGTVEQFTKNLLSSNTGMTPEQADESIFGTYLTQAKNAFNVLSTNKNIQSATNLISKYIGLDVKGISSINQMYSNFANVKSLADLRELIPGNSLGDVQNSLQNYKNMLTMNTVSLKLKTGSLLQDIAEEMYITDIPVMRDFFIAGGANGATGTMPKAYQFIQAIVTKEYPILNQSSPDLHASLVASVMGLSASDTKVYRDYIKQSLIGEAKKYNEVNKANGTDIPYYIPPSIDVDDRECFKIEIERETNIKVRSCPDGWDYDKTTDCCFNPNTKVYSFCGTDSKKSEDKVNSSGGVVGGSTTTKTSTPKEIPACITPYENNSYVFINTDAKRFWATYDEKGNWYALVGDVLNIIDTKKCSITYPTLKPLAPCIEVINGEYFFTPKIKNTLADEPFQTKLNPAIIDSIEYADQNGDIVTYKDKQHQVLAIENMKNGDVKYSDVANNYFKSQNISIPAIQLINNPLVQSVNIKNIALRKDIQTMANNGLLEQKPWHKDIIVYYDKKGNPIAAEDLRNGAKYYGDGPEAKLLVYSRSAKSREWNQTLNYEENINVYNQSDPVWNNQNSFNSNGTIQDVLRLTPLQTTIANTDSAIKTVDTAEPDEKLFASNLKSGIPVVGINIGKPYERWFLKNSPNSEIIDCEIWSPVSSQVTNSVSCGECVPNCITETKDKNYIFNYKGTGDYRHAQKIGGVWFALFDDGHYYQINIATCDFINKKIDDNSIAELTKIVNSNSTKIEELTQIININKNNSNVDKKFIEINEELRKLRLDNSTLEELILKLPTPKDGVNGKDGINGKDGVNGKDGTNANSINYDSKFDYIQKIYTNQEQRINELENLIKIIQTSKSSENNTSLIKELQIQLENEKSRNTELQKVTKEVKSSENNTSYTKVTDSEKSPTKKTPTNSTECTDCDKLAMPKVVIKSEKIIYDKNFDDDCDECED